MFQRQSICAPRNTEKSVEAGSRAFIVLHMLYTNPLCICKWCVWCWGTSVDGVANSRHVFIYSEYQIAPLKLFARLISIPPETTWWSPKWEMLKYNNAPRNRSFLCWIHGAGMALMDGDGANLATGQRSHLWPRMFVQGMRWWLRRKVKARLRAKHRSDNGNGSCRLERWMISGAGTSLLSAAMQTGPNCRFSCCVIRWLHTEHWMGWQAV